jgi:hypothetical protein
MKHETLFFFPTVVLCTRSCTLSTVLSQSSQSLSKISMIILVSQGRKEIREVKQTPLEISLGYREGF